jgi:hypothetical protein
MLFQRSIELMAKYIDRQISSGSGLDIEVAKEIMARLAHQPLDDTT